MLRIPSRQDFADLFYTPDTVDGAVALLTRSQQRVGAVAARCSKLAVKAKDDAAWLRQLAEQEALRADIHTAEADRALRVSSKLNDLLN